MTRGGSIDYLDECPACGTSLDERRLDVHLHRDHLPGDFGEPVEGIDAPEAPRARQAATDGGDDERDR